MTRPSPFKPFKNSPETIKLAVMYGLRYPLSLRWAEGIVHERGIDICHEAARVWWSWFGPFFARQIRRRRSNLHASWRWHIEEVFVRMSGGDFISGSLVRD